MGGNLDVTEIIITHGLISITMMGMGKTFSFRSGNVILRKNV